MSNKKSSNQLQKTIKITTVLVSTALLVVAVFVIYNIFQKSLESTNKDNGNSGYFNESIIKKIRELNSKQDTADIPEGRISPFAR